MGRKSVGYFEGTDSALLTSLVCEGYDTLPVSNGADNHGKDVRHITSTDKYDLLIGYVHKIYAPVGWDLPYQELFHICKTYGIPMLLEVPADLVDAAKRIIGDAPPEVRFVDPDDALDLALEILRADDVE